MEGDGGNTYGDDTMAPQGTNQEAPQKNISTRLGKFQSFKRVLEDFPNLLLFLNLLIECYN